MIRKSIKFIMVLTVVFFVVGWGGPRVDALSVKESQINGTYVSDQIIVKFKSGSAEKGFQVMEAQDDYSILEVNQNNGYQLLRVTSDKDPAEVVSSLRKSGLVEMAEINHVYHTSSLPNDPYFNNQWGLKTILADCAWDLAAGAHSVVVAVLDTGINAEHLDLQGRVLTGKNFFNTSNPDYTSDGNGHGTHVAGIIGAITGNGIGVAGIASGIRLLPVKVLDDQGDGTDWTVAQGIDYAVASGAKIINLSLGSYYGSSLLEAAVNNALQKGVLLVAAAGNKGWAHVDYPAAYPNVIAVSAMDSSGALASFSNYGAQVWVSAPGVSVISTFAGPQANPSNPYAYLNGTSMAAPFVSGLAALVLSEDTALTGQNLKDILSLSADDLGAVGKDSKFGYGRINAYKAVDYGKISIFLENSTVEIGDPVHIKVSVCDILGQVKTGVSAYVNLNASSSNTQLPVLPVEIINGVWEGEFVVNDPGTYSIMATDTGSPVKWLSGTSSELNVMNVSPPQNVQGIRGKVMLEGRDSHQGIIVQIYGQELAVETQEDGYFEILDLPEENYYDLLISFDRYLRREVSHVAVNQGVLTLLPELWLKAGDIDGNDVVNLFDLVILSHGYGTCPGEIRWNPFADINMDDEVGIEDLVWLAKNYGEAGGTDSAK